MSKKKRVVDLHVPMALYTADSYFVAAVRARYDSQEKMVRGKLERFSGQSCVAISSHAFAIEVYIKVLIYLVEGLVFDSHDLMYLWHKLPADLRAWISENFENNLDDESKKWANSLFIDPRLIGTSKVVKARTGENTAKGVLKSHKLAFQIGRYAYELPSENGLKAIPHNVPALELVSALLRGLTYHLHNKRDEAMQSSKSRFIPAGTKQSLNVELPTGKLDAYPEDAIRIINEKSQQ